MRFYSQSPAETRAAALSLAGCISDSGLLVSLVGELGAGKTAFARGLAEGLGVDPGVVSSPTFVIAHAYDAAGGRMMHHIDFYRIENVADLEATGFLDMLAPGSVVAVEWANRFASELPTDRLELRIERSAVAESTASTGDGQASGNEDEDEPASPRSFYASATGPESQRVLSAWQEAAVTSPGDPRLRFALDPKPAPERSPRPEPR